MLMTSAPSIHTSNCQTVQCAKEAQCPSARHGQVRVDECRSHSELCSLIGFCSFLCLTIASLYRSSTASSAVTFEAWPCMIAPRDFVDLDLCPACSPSEGSIGGVPLSTFY